MKLKLAGDREQFIQGQQKRHAQIHHNGFLRRGRRGLQPLRHVRPVLNLSARSPLAEGDLLHVVPAYQHPDGPLALCDLRGTDSLTSILRGGTNTPSTALAHRITDNAFCVYDLRDATVNLPWTG